MNASQVYAQRHAGLSRGLDASILRLGSVAVRDVLAYQLSGGEDDYLVIREAMLSGAPEAAIDANSHKWTVDGLLRLARVLALQDVKPCDRLVAYRILMAVGGHYGKKGMPSAYRKLLVELSIQLGEWKVAEKWLALLPANLAFLGFFKADLCNPHMRPGQMDAAWLGQVNQALSGDVRLALDVGLVADSGDDSVFGALSSAEEHPDIDGPLVTIGVACWCPDATLLTSLHSLLKQSWRNLEIIVVDDCSPLEYQPLLEKVAALDPRVRVLRQEANGGTYLIRNRVLQEARGVFFTVQDADDWSHPLRIQRQVEAMQAHEEWIACHCWGFRCNDNLQFNLVGVAPCRINESSLLFRREKATQAVGMYHASRKGADSEYTSRLRLHFGDQAVGLVGDCLTGIRLSTGSLSRSEFKPGWRHPNRAIYRRNYMRWQEQAEFSRINLGVKSIDLPDFPAPRAFMPDRTGVVPAYDCVVVGDFRGGNARWIDRVIPGLRSMHEQGLLVSICHVDTLRSADTQAFEDYDVRILELIATGIAEVSISDNVTAKKLVFLSAVELQYLDPPYSISLAAEQAYILMKGEDLAGDSHGIHFDLGNCLDRAYEIAGVMPRCVPCDDQALRALTERLPRDWIDVTMGWGGTQKTMAESGPGLVGPPAIGIHLPREGVIYTRAWILQPRTRPVRLSVPGFSGKHKYLPDHVRIYERSTEGVDGFLKMIDVLVDMHEWKGQAAISDMARMALEQGCRLMLPESWRTFTGGQYSYFDPRVGPAL